MTRVSPAEQLVLVNDELLIVTGADLVRRAMAALDQLAIPVEKPMLDRASQCALLTLPSGEVVEVASAAVIGRMRQADVNDVVSVVIDNPHVSATHVRLELIDGAIVVTDLSTNGTMVSPPGDTRRLLVKGEPTVVQPESTLSLADGIDVALTMSGCARR
jgi:hypothetical protein